MGPFMKYTAILHTTLPNTATYCNILQHTPAKRDLSSISGGYD